MSDRSAPHLGHFPGNGWRMTDGGYGRNDYVLIFSTVISSDIATYATVLRSSQKHTFKVITVKIIEDRCSVNDNTKISLLS